MMSFNLNTCNDIGWTVSCCNLIGWLIAMTSHGIPEASPLGDLGLDKDTGINLKKKCI